jgi:hypothetical protein
VSREIDEGVVCKSTEGVMLSIKVNLSFAPPFVSCTTKPIAVAGVGVDISGTTLNCTGWGITTGGGEPVVRACVVPAVSVANTVAMKGFVGTVIEPSNSGESASALASRSRVAVANEIPVGSERVRVALATGPRIIARNIVEAPGGGAPWSGKRP